MDIRSTLRVEAAAKASLEGLARTILGSSVYGQADSWQTPCLVTAFMASRRYRTGVRPRWPVMDRSLKKIKSLDGLMARIPCNRCSYVNAAQQRALCRCQALLDSIPEDILAADRPASARARWNDGGAANTGSRADLQHLCRASGGSSTWLWILTGLLRNGNMCFATTR